MKSSSNIEPLTSTGIVESYSRLLPREVFTCILNAPGKRKQYLYKDLEVLQKPGVYVLYREDEPHYIGLSDGPLMKRLEMHARKPLERYDLFWTHFSVFVIAEKKHREDIERILIAAMPSANSAQPKLPRAPVDRRVTRLMQQQREVRLKESLIEED